jgi:hypothetical protein
MMDIIKRDKERLRKSSDEGITRFHRQWGTPGCHQDAFSLVSREIRAKNRDIDRD